MYFFGSLINVVGNWQLFPLHPGDMPHKIQATNDALFCVDAFERLAVLSPNTSGFY